MTNWDMSQMLADAGMDPEYNFDVADPVEVEEIVSRMVEAQQPGNRFELAIIQDTADQAEQIMQFNAGELAGITYNKQLTHGLAAPQPFFEEPIFEEDNMTQPSFIDSLLGIHGSTEGLTGITPGQEADPMFGVAAGVSPLASVGAPAIAGILEKIGVPAAIAGTLGLAAATAAAARLKFPWQTPEGEGFIAPWTNQAYVPGTELMGTQARVDAGYYGAQGAQGAPWGAGFGGVAPGAVAQSWDNAAKDGSTQASAQYVKLVGGGTYVRSIKTGVIKKLHRPRITAVHSRMRLNDVAKAQGQLDRIYKLIAKRTPLKRGK